MAIGGEALRGAYQNRVVLDWLAPRFRGLDRLPIAYSAEQCTVAGVLGAQPRDFGACIHELGCCRTVMDPECSAPMVKPS